MNWQPIETAPKDRQILLWDGFDRIVGWWAAFTDGGEWYTRSLCAEEPTHWQELPNPPALVSPASPEADE